MKRRCSQLGGAGLQVGILDNAYTLRIGADASKSEESVGEDLIRTFEVDVKGANVVHWRHDDAETEPSRNLPGAF